MYAKGRRLLCFLTMLILSILLSAPALATNNDYDSEHPEKLNDANLYAQSAIQGVRCHSRCL